MPKKQGASRRSFLAGSATGLSSAWLVSQWPAILAAQEHAQKVARSSKPGKLGFFSAEQAAEVESVAAQIVPTDDTPGAREAGCLYFIDSALTTFDVKKQSVYTQGPRAHDVPNLYVVDGSSFVTSARNHPTCTISALAYRAADNIIKNAKNGSIKSPTGA
jgi:hypothetical protein